MTFINRMRGLMRDDSGQDLLEYAMLVGLVALICVGAVTLAGTHVNTIFTKIATELGKIAA